MKKNILIVISILLFASCTSTEEYIEKDLEDTEPIESNLESLKEYTFRGYGKQFYTPKNFDLDLSIVTENENLNICQKNHFSKLEIILPYLEKQKQIEFSIIPSKLTLVDNLINSNKSGYWGFA